jgi:hypothetical protein
MEPSLTYENAIIDQNLPSGGTDTDAEVLPEH